MTIDAGLGGTFQQKDSDKFFGSPSHESDSGYSMSSESVSSPGSGASPTDEFDLLNELKELSQVGFDSYDGELVDYFGGDRLLGETASEASEGRPDSRSSREDFDADMAICGIKTDCVQLSPVHEPVPTPQVIIVKAVGKLPKKETVIKPVGSGTERRMTTRGSLLVVKSEENSTKDPNSPSEMKPVNKSKCAGQSKPSVHVVKVINTPNSQVSEEDIMYEIEKKSQKNAIQARINRQKKKAYITDLEDQVKDLQDENAELKKQNDNDKIERESLTEEISYLKNILANQSSLSTLLQNIPNVKNIKLSTSFASKRRADVDHDYLPKTKRTKVSENAGVCLHVKDEAVSLEFCSHCSSNADS